MVEYDTRDLTQQGDQIGPSYAVISGNSTYLVITTCPDGVYRYIINFTVYASAWGACRHAFAVLRNGVYYAIQTDYYQGGAAYKQANTANPFMLRPGDSLISWDLTAGSIVRTASAQFVDYCMERSAKSVFKATRRG